MSQLAATAADNNSPATACFSIHARAEPGVMPRVLELFAKRGLVPTAWRSGTSGPDHSLLTIDIRIGGLAGEATDYIAACLRQIVNVEAVLTSQTNATGWHQITPCRSAIT
jgi:acetolactate synthase small subunit